MLETQERPRRAIVLAVHLTAVTDGEFEASLTELRQLARTLGVTVIGTLTQRRGAFDASAYVGEGKREDLKALIGPPEDPRCELLLVEHELSPSQARNLEKESGCEVLDRTQLILEIFHQHARSRAARAQVEIVRLEYLAPRLRESGKGGDRQRGGIGGKGAGESSLELDRRKIRDRIAELTVELQAHEAEKRTQRARRSERTGLERVALVGYTNAGKSTWMRALTGSEVYVADKLFATLDTTVRPLVPESVPRVLVSDTVGFIRNLPHGLVASFKSTLDEALEASLLLHVVDASDPGYARQLAVTDEVLDEIGARDVPRLLVFNKIDRAADEAETRRVLLERWPDAQVLSALRPDDVRTLRAALIEHFSRDLVEAELRVTWDRQKLRAEIFAHCQVLAERSEDDAAFFRVRASKETLARLDSLLAQDR
ncbi:MAG TPA: GTPase HflX [Polyangia bacterium]|nr:GTPase HflX [Polyangia bacterium]